MTNEKFECSAIVWHGGGHQSKTLCNRTDGHDITEHHYVKEVVWSWWGPEAYTDPWGRLNEEDD